MDGGRECSVVVLNWENAHDTLACVRTVLASTHPELAIVVCDNHSSDSCYRALASGISELASATGAGDRPDAGGDCELVADFDRAGLPSVRITLLRSHENLGYAGGNNLAIRYALAHGAEFLLILNNDTEVEPDAIARMIETAAGAAEIGLVGACIRDYDRRERVQALGGARLNPWLLRVRYVAEDTLAASLRDRPAGHVEDLDYVSGACTLATRDMIAAVGLMREDFFLYFEEIEWAARARAAGWTLAVADDAVIYHRSTKRDAQKRAVATYYYVRNGLKVVTSYYPWALPAALGTQALRALLLPLCGRLQDAISVCRGIIAFCVGRRGRVVVAG